MKSLRQSFVRKSPLLLAAVAVFLIVAEVIVSTSGRAPKDVYYWQTNPRGVTQKYAIGTMPEISYTTNLQGLREKDIILPEHDGRIRIIVVGSSQIFGWGLQNGDTLTEAIQGVLREDLHSDRIDVVNFGVPGGLFRNSMRYIYHYARHLSPDLIVLGIQKGRDNNTEADLMSDDEIVPALENWTTWAGEPDLDPEAKIRNTVWWRSALFRLVFRSRHHVDYRLYRVDWPGFAHTRVEQRKAEVTPLAAPFTPERCLIEKQSTALCEPSFEVNLTDPYMKKLFDLLMKAGRIQSACRCAESPEGLAAAIKNAATVPANYEDVLVLRPDTQAKRTRELQLIAKAVALMRDWVKPADLVTFTYPYGWGILDLDPVTVARDSAQIWPREAILSTYMEDTFRKYCVDEGQDCFTITPPLVEFGRGKKAQEIITPDAHLGPATIKIAARAVADHIKPYVERRLSQKN